MSNKNPLLDHGWDETDPGRRRVRREPRLEPFLVHLNPVRQRITLFGEETVWLTFVATGAIILGDY